MNLNKLKSNAAHVAYGEVLRYFRSYGYHVKADSAACLSMFADAVNCLTIDQQLDGSDPN